MEVLPAKALPTEALPAEAVPVDNQVLQATVELPNMEVLLDPPCHGVSAGDPGLTEHTELQQEDELALTLEAQASQSTLSSSVLPSGSSIAGSIGAQKDALQASVELSNMEVLPASPCHGAPPGHLGLTELADLRLQQEANLALTLEAKASQVTLPGDPPRFCFAFCL